MTEDGLDGRRVEAESETNEEKWKVICRFLSASAKSRHFCAASIMSSRPGERRVLDYADGADVAREQKELRPPKRLKR